MKFENFNILATAGYTPERVVPNSELTTMMTTSDEWIVQRTGIHQRHVVTAERTSDLCTRVAQQLLQRSGLQATDIDYIVVATMSPDYQTPAVSAQVQGNIGATKAVALDVNAACSGFVYGLQVVHRLLMGDSPKTALLIGGETLSRLVDWQDRSTAVLFGDGAGGVVLTSALAQDGAFIAADYRTMGEQGRYLTAGANGVDSPFASDPQPVLPFFKMNGRRVYNFAIKQVPASLRRVLDQGHLAVTDIDYFILHQANQRIIERIAEDLTGSMAQFPVNIGQYGNTAAASEPLLLNQLVTSHVIKRGDVLALSGFGGGLTIGTMILRY